LIKAAAAVAHKTAAAFSATAAASARPASTAAAGAALQQHKLCLQNQMLIMTLMPAGEIQRGEPMQPKVLFYM
jgi:hypothetical protein